MTAPRVVGLDLSMTATGVALPEGGTLTVKPKGDADLAVVEDMPARLQANAAKAVGFAHGTVRTMLLDLDVPYAVVPPATLKSFATGKGSADKTAMAIAALKRAGLEFGDDNECDAWWLRAAGLDRVGHPEFPLPAAQRDRLDKVKWPALKEGSS